MRECPSEGVFLTVKSENQYFRISVVIDGKSDDGTVVSCQDAEEFIYEMKDALDLFPEQIILVGKVPLYCDEMNMVKHINDYVLASDN